MSRTGTFFSRPRPQTCWDINDMSGLGTAFLVTFCIKTTSLPTLPVSILPQHEHRLSTVENGTCTHLRHTLAHNCAVPCRNCAMLDRPEVLAWHASSTCKAVACLSDKQAVDQAEQCLQQGSADVFWLQLWTLADLYENRYVQIAILQRLLVHVWHDFCLLQSSEHTAGCCKTA